MGSGQVRSGVVGRIFLSPVGESPKFTERQFGFLMRWVLLATLCSAWEGPSPGACTFYGIRYNFIFGASYSFLSACFSLLKECDFSVPNECCFGA